MAFLDYLLGGVSGGFEGYERKKANEMKAKQDEEERQIRLASLFSQGFEPVADVQRKKQAAVGAAGSMAMTALNSVLGGAPRAVPPMADQQALAQGYATAKPERAIAFGGQQLALRETPTERQDRLARGEEMRKRQSAEETARVAARAKTAEQERLNELAAGALRGGPRSPEAIRLALENPSAYKAIYDNAGQMTEYQRAMLGLSRERLDYERTRQTAQDKPTPVPASDRRSMTELEASVKELDKALKAVDDSPQAFGLKTILPNPLLSRQAGVKPRADVMGAIVKLRRTEFGTAMSRQEAESGVSLFPVIGGLTGGDNADAIRDKLTALKEKAMLELNTKREFYGMPAVAPGSAAQPAAPAPAKAPPAPARGGATSADDWIAANPQRSGETDAQYKARYKASVRGGR
jgi:hypothetical protein